MGKIWANKAINAVLGHRLPRKVLNTPLSYRTKHRPYQTPRGGVQYPKDFKGDIPNTHKVDWEHGHAAPMSQGPAEAKTLYRGMSDAEYNDWTNNGVSSRPMSWWSDSPSAPEEYLKNLPAGESGKILQTKVKLNPQDKTRFVESHDPHLTARYPKGWGQGGNLIDNKSNDTWFSMKNSYIRDNMIGKPTVYKTTEL